MGLLLTVSQGLRDGQGTFLGVAALDIAFPYLIDNYLDPPELKDVVEAFLVGRDGMVIIRSSEAEDAFEADTYEPKAFPHLDQLPRDGLAARSAGWRTFETAEGVHALPRRSRTSSTRRCAPRARLGAAGPGEGMPWVRRCPPRRRPPPRMTG